MKYIFGLQRSGTNFLEALLDFGTANYGVTYQSKFWKHAYNIPNPPKNTIYIYKRLPKWLESIERNPVDIHKHKEKDLEKLWHDHTSFWMKHAQQVIQYEALLSDPHAFFPGAEIPTKVWQSETFTEEHKKAALEGWETTPSKK